MPPKKQPKSLSFAGDEPSVKPSTASDHKAGADTSIGSFPKTLAKVTFIPEVMHTENSNPYNPQWDNEHIPPSISLSENEHYYILSFPAGYKYESHYGYYEPGRPTCQKVIKYATVLIPKTASVETIQQGIFSAALKYTQAGNNYNEDKDSQIKKAKEEAEKNKWGKWKNGNFIPRSITDAWMENRGSYDVKDRDNVKYDKCGWYYGWLVPVLAAISFGVVIAVIHAYFIR